MPSIKLPKYRSFVEAEHVGKRSNYCGSLAPVLDRGVTARGCALAGGVAGASSWLSIYPIDVVKSRLQAHGAATARYTGWRHCVVRCNVPPLTLPCLALYLHYTLVWLITLGSRPDTWLLHV